MSNTSHRGSKILLAAFNKKIAVELQDRLSKGSVGSSRAWSLQQNAVFDFFEGGSGNLVVRARAGTGKTTTIVEACSRIPDANVDAKTLHSLGFSYIRRQWKDAKVDAGVDYDRAATAVGKGGPDEIIELVQKLCAWLKNAAPFLMDVEEVVEIAEERDLVPDEEWEEEGWTGYRVAKAAIAARDMAKERDEQGRISFDDMIFIPVACKFARPWYDMVVIDEAQDMNYAQLLLAQMACKKGGRIAVVGDDRQAIYGFRGADADGIDRLKAELAARETGLTTTYRCGKKIVEVARRLVPDFAAGDTNPEGVVDTIKGYEDVIKQAKPGDFVLSRTNAPLMPLCLKFLKAGRKARIEGRDVAAGLRAIVAGMKAKTVPQFIQRVEGWREKQLTRTAKLKKKEARDAKIDVINDQAEMLVAMAEGCASVSEILNRTYSLFGDSEGSSPTDAVVMSSVHRSKGLEADRVFVLADTVNERSREEQNIAYVAYTRAKLQLTWVHK